STRWDARSRRPSTAATSSASPPRSRRSTLGRSLSERTILLRRVERTARVFDDRARRRLHGAALDAVAREPDRLPETAAESFRLDGERDLRWVDPRRELGLLPRVHLCRARGDRS